jgi:hypothetical protein
VFHAALCVLTDTMPRIKAVEEHMEEKWREEWYYYRSGNWTKRLVTDACTFRKYRRDIGYFTMQILTGHRIFNVYSKTINKEVHTRCWDCDNEEDDAVHALFHCARWIRERTELENYVSTLLTMDNFIKVIIRKEDNWITFQAWSLSSYKIMTTRQIHERNLKRRIRTVR